MTFKAWRNFMKRKIRNGEKIPEEEESFSSTSEEEEEEEHPDDLQQQLIKNKQRKRQIVQEDQMKDEIKKFIKSKNGRDMTIVK